MFDAFGDRFNKMTGRTRFVVCRLFVHCRGDYVAPLLGVLNQAARVAVQEQGDLVRTGSELVKVCQSLLEATSYWQSAANEGDVFWQEEAAGDYVSELFTDSASRYLSQTSDFYTADTNQPLTLPVTHNLVVMITAAYVGEVAPLETDLADIDALTQGLKALINLHYQNSLRAIQVHFSPAQLGDELTDDQVLENFPELIPL
ncbi:DUF1517 domain-containing protein [Ancylothrix sp. C2]|uniref:DUF1517 domain-containing protein n=1 Tax=Ancylothrix sp. D3o TaxID=2953691 RepID=UPI0021BAF114|nr:DUF1517 domain-containing protein [Ancylothrix sp. D3o]MCT7949513.1 DUF1517 domain-containing protein [Ancylothrix sp. D3o]